MAGREVAASVAAEGASPAKAPRPVAAGLASGPAIVGYVALAKLALHLATATVYGFFIDELYFLACGEHLAWGYVDFPPLTAFQAWLTRALFGDSPYSIRLFPALAGAGLVLITGAMARRLGGRRFAQALAAVCVLAAPVFLAFSTYLSMNPVEALIWAGGALVVLRMIQTGDTRLWVVFGLLAGVGLLNKHTMLLFGFAVVVGLLLTPERRLLASRWLLVGGAVALALALPNLLWEIRHGFPHAELLANIRRHGRDVDVGFLPFWKLELLFLNPVAAPVWIVGLVGLFRVPALKPARALGWAYLVTLACLFVTTPGSHKTYYASSAYPILIASGAVLIERFLTAPHRQWLKPAYLTLILVVGGIIAPTVVPILPPETYLRYTEAIGLAQPRLENRATNAMPQLFADRFGWPEMVEKVARVYSSLPPALRVKTGIFANDFGQAGAVDFYGPRLGLPKAISGHLTYWYWGPRGYTGESLIVLGERREVLETEFEDVRAVAEVGHPYAMRQEHFTVFLCQRPRGWTLQSIWPRVKNWN
jgi:Dolichyl-phosphate-mannose-protein mannosyltransferase